MENVTENEEEKKIHEELRDLLKRWVQLTESKEVLDDIDLETQSAGKLFRDVADVKGKKRLFVCCDGTWQNAVGTVRPMSNVAKLARSIYRVGSHKFDCGTLGGIPQLAYYSSGIGSNSIVGIDGLVAATTGKGFTSTVLNAYCFISNNYNGISLRDDIILVGYSRGAFAMRCLAQFISDVGLLRRSGLPHLGMFWKLWLSDEKLPGENQPQWKTKQEELEILFFAEAKIEVLAEWDPVKSLIWPSLQGKRRLANMTNTVPNKVKNAFVAISLHEKRWSYKPVVWEQYEKGQEVCQCAFLGNHSDIGGGNVDAGLSTISLFWMVAKIEQACEAWFDEKVLSEFVRPEKVRGARQILRPMGKMETCLTTQALSEGNVNESSFLWHLPHLISLGRHFNGNRSRLLESAAKTRTQQEERREEEAGQEQAGQEQAGQEQAGQEDAEREDAGMGEAGQEEAQTRREYVECELELHKTVNWIMKKWDNDGRCPSALNGFVYEEPNGWKTGKGKYLKEADLETKELKLMRAWWEAANKAQGFLAGLREKKRNEETGDIVPDTDGTRILEHQAPDQQDEEDGPEDEDEDVLDIVDDWKRWRRAVSSEDTMNINSALVQYMRKFFERELKLREQQESESQNELQDNV